MGGDCRQGQQARPATLHGADPQPQDRALEQPQEEHLQRHHRALPRQQPARQAGCADDVGQRREDRRFLGRVRGVPHHPSAGRHPLPRRRAARQQARNVDHPRAG